MLLFVVNILLLAILFYFVFIKPYKEVDKLPGPSTFQLIKNFHYYSSREGLITYFQTLNEKYGLVVKVWMKPLKPMIVTNDPEYVEKIFKSQELHITPSFLEMTFMRNGIASMPDYNLWKKHKQIVNKAITREYIATKISVYDEKYNEFLDIIKANVGKPFDVEKPLYRIVLDIMIHTMKDSNVELTKTEVENYTKYRTDFFSLLFERMNSFRMMGVFHKFTKNYKLINESKDSIVRFGKIWLERFKKVKKELRDKHNLVYAFLESDMPEEYIVDNINTMIQGGHETSIIPLALGFHEMAKRPELQQKLLDEIYSVIGRDKNVKVTLRDLDEMVYLHAFIKECLRLYMPAPFLDRKTIKEVEINGVKIPKDTVIMFQLRGVLTSDAYYENPLDFNPDRFLKENLIAKTQKGFISFGYGLKTCPGKNIAYAAMKLLVVKILREFEVCPLEEDFKVELVAEIFFRSVHGIPIVFRKRTSS